MSVITFKDHRGRDIALSFYRNGGFLRGTLVVIAGEKTLLSTRFRVLEQDAALLVGQLGGTLCTNNAECALAGCADCERSYGPRPDADNGPDYCTGCGTPVGVSGCGCDHD